MAKFGTLKQRILAGAIALAILLLVIQRRHRSAIHAAAPVPSVPVAVEQTQPAPQLTRASSPIEVVPSQFELAPGGTKLFFARTILPGNKTFHYDSRLFLWKLQEKDGGSLKPNGNSRLYYSYTAPKTPGRYHILVGLKGNAKFQTVVPVTVGSLAAKPAADTRRPASFNKGAALPQ